jgi:hypothetical protein
LDIKAIEEVVELMRRLGVVSLKQGDLELLLGPDPAMAEMTLEKLFEKHEPEEEPDKPQERSRLNSLYDHPSLKWPGGERPRIEDKD